MLGKIFNSGSHLGFSIIFSTGSYLLHSHNDNTGWLKHNWTGFITSYIDSLFRTVSCSCFSGKGIVCVCISVCICVYLSSQRAALI